MARIQSDEVARIAALARLSLSEEEAQAMAGDLDRILDYVASLEGLDTEGIEPMAHAIPIATPVRPDVAVEPMDPERAVANAPDAAGTAFVVPRVLESEER